MPIYRRQVIKPTADLDAVAYIGKVGITDVVAQNAINDFVLGMKALNYYSSMVVWLFRSSQNKGSGTTAYSLGGLGAFDGTLTNGPTWSADGIVFDGNNDFITLPDGTFGTGNSAESFFAFFQPTGGSGRVLIGAGNSATQVVSYYHLKAGATGNDLATMAYTDTTITASDTSWKSLFQGNTTLGFKGKNGGTVTSFTLNNTLNKTGTNCAIGGFIPFAGTNHFQGTISAVIKINATPETQLNSDVHTLYKTTLGLGLGLP
jgi:hypothetical protein